MNTVKAWKQSLQFFVITTLHIANSINSITSPNNQSVFLNDDIEFHCQLSNNEGYQVIWIQDYNPGDNVLHAINADMNQDMVPLDNEGHGVYNVQYSTFLEPTFPPTVTYNLNLRINDVKVSDEGSHACGYMIRISNPPFRQPIPLGNWANLTILIPPNEINPSCSYSPASISLSTSFDSVSVTMMCEISGGKPLPGLTWYKMTSPISSTSTSTNNFEIMLSAEDNGVQFTCFAKGPALLQDGRCTIIPLQVLPSVSVSHPTMPLVEHSNAVLTCVSSGLPYISKIEWNYNDQILLQGVMPFEFLIVDKSDRSSELHLFGIQLISNNAIISCHSEIPSGLSNRDSVTILVAYVVTPDTTASRPAITVTEKAKDPMSITGVTSSLVTSIAAAAGVIILVLIIAIIATVILRRRKANAQRNRDTSETPVVLDALDNTYQMGVVATDNELRITPSDQPATDGYVINHISGMNSQGDEPRSVTMGSDHPYDPVNFSSRQSDTRTRTPTNVAHLANRQAASPYASNIDGDSERLSYAELDLPHGPPIPRRQGYSTDYAVIEGEL
ncbi:uncharacterized protein [Amphiura filiformis]|uniref:uncharacterized protein isoform X1 n=1 Tax=Amphiura filiformis TaxID=82378 RepID=UPI003B212788